MHDIRERAHVLNHLHLKCVVGVFDKILQEGYI